MHATADCHSMAYGTKHDESVTAIQTAQVERQCLSVGIRRSYELGLTIGTVDSSLGSRQKVLAVLMTSTIASAVGIPLQRAVAA